MHGAFVKGGPQQKQLTAEPPGLQNQARTILYLWGSCPLKQSTYASIFIKILPEFERVAHVLRRGQHRKENEGPFGGLRQRFFGCIRVCISTWESTGGICGGDLWSLSRREVGVGG